MSGNVYDVAYHLENAIRQTSEYSKLKEQYEELYRDDLARRMFEKFRGIQISLQEKQMMGQPITEEEVQEAQSIVLQVQQNEKIASLMEAEQQMSMVISEINKIVMKPLEELYGI